MMYSFVCRGMGEGGGIQRVISEITKRLSNNSHITVNIISDNFPEELKVYKNVNIIKIPTLANNKFIKMIPRYLFVLICQSIFIIFSSIYIMIKRKKLGKVFNHGVGQTLVQDYIVFHSCHHEWVEKKREKKGVRTLLNPLDWIILTCEKINVYNSKDKNILSVSSYTTKQLCKHFDVSNKEIITIPNGVNIEKFRPVKKDRDYYRQFYNFSESETVVLFVANEWKRKGLSELAMAIGTLKDDYNIKLVIAGRNLRGICEKLKKDFSLEQVMTYLGEVTEIEKLYRVSDVFCVPSDEDAFGLVYAEAMASGIPVIATNQCGIKDYIVNGENGFIINNVNKEQEIIDIIKYICKNKQKAIAIGDNARKTVEKEMSWNKISQEYLKLINS